MGIIDDLKTMMSGRELPWDRPYEKMSTAELVGLKVEHQRSRDASDDPSVRAACNARIAVVNGFLDKSVAFDDAQRALASMSDAAREALVLQVQNVRSKVGVIHG